jgi:hypothetical protein
MDTKETIISEKVEEISPELAEIETEEALLSYLDGLDQVQGSHGIIYSIDELKESIRMILQTKNPENLAYITRGKKDPKVKGLRTVVGKIMKAQINSNK